MSNTMNRIASDLQKIMSESAKKKTSGFDTQAVVTRLDGDTAWVKFPGGDDETPVRRTTNAGVGDNVQVRVSGGRAWLLGNVTNPPTDDTQANIATDAAQDADRKAVDAIENASIAKIAADSAQAYAEQAKETTDEINAYAEVAGKTVTQILQDGETAGEKAQEASRSAQRAYDAANASLTQLGMVEDVVGALNWISSHATYQKSNDTAVIQNKFYFTLNGTAVENPVGSPSNKGYYELVDNIYELSEDSEVDATKTYYTVVAVSATPTQSPSSEGLYEVRDLSEGVSQYIASHLALDESGLHVVNGSSRIDLSPSGGIDIWSNSKKIAHYGSDAQLGDTNGYHIDIQSGTNARLSFKNNDTEIAYMSKDMLYIPRAVVVDSMQVGDESEGGAWRWVIDPSSRSLTLSWIGGV